MTRSVASLLALVLAACSAPRSDGPPPPSSMTVDTYWAAIINIYCDSQARCDSRIVKADCVKALQGFASGRGFDEPGTHIAAVKAGKVGFDSASAQKCIEDLTAEMTTKSCQQLRIGEDPTAISSGDCLKVFSGTVDDGGMCVADVECKAGSFCAESTSDEETTVCAGTCVHGGTQCHTSAECADGKVCDAERCLDPVAPGAENMPCGSNGACQAGLFCEYLPGGNLCKAPAMENGECSGSSAGCVVGTICVYLNDSSNKSRCLSVKAKGEACQNDSQCAGTYASLVCDPTAHTCQEAPSTGPCPSGLCSGSNYCDTSGSTWTCKPKVALGGSCRVSNYGADCEGTWIRCEPTTPGASTGTCVAQEACVP